MKTWMLDAIDPLFFGDGRPVAQGVAHGRLLPPPQVLAGLARTRQGQDATGAWIGDPTTARQIAVQGPFPALLDKNGAVREWLFLRPSDALETEKGLQRLVPLDFGTRDLRTNAPSANGAPLAPVGSSQADPSKPISANPLWRWSEYESWLARPDVAMPRPGVPAPPIEARTHVAIDPDTQQAKDGLLFSTRGRRLLVAITPDEICPIGLGLRTDAAVNEGVAPAGGERRLVRWRRAEGVPLPSVPKPVLDSAADGSVRVILATPGLFRGGWRPEVLFDAPTGSVLVAACVGRPEVISGWDLAARPGGQARPTRRCAPAGSVYFLRLGGTPAERRAWATAAWLASKADLPDDRIDGFATLLLGVWDGRLTPVSILNEV